MRDIHVFDDLRYVPAACFLVLGEETTCHPDGETFTYTATGTNACTGEEATFSATGSGGEVGEPFCFTVIVTDDEGGLCCTTQLCTTVPDCSQPAEAGDLDGDGVVSTSDLLLLLGAWGSDPGGPPDFDLNGSVGASDLLILLKHWG
jgi:hypothetical protein